MLKIAQMHVGNTKLPCGFSLSEPKPHSQTSRSLTETNHFPHPWIQLVLGRISAN